MSARANEPLWRRWLRLHGVSIPTRHTLWKWRKAALKLAWEKWGAQRACGLCKRPINGTHAIVYLLAIKPKGERSAYLRRHVCTLCWEMVRHQVDLWETTLMREDLPPENVAAKRKPGRVNAVV